MTAAEQRFYPKGYLAMGNGDLVQVTNISHQLNNDAKQVSTIRLGQAGITLGPGSSQVSFDAVIDEGGAERNYWRDCMNGNIRQLRLKLPAGRTLTINGVFQSVNTDAPIDDAVKVSCTFIGKTEPQ